MSNLKTKEDERKEDGERAYRTEVEDDADWRNGGLSD
jgi:hypothetical protein